VLLTGSAAKTLTPGIRPGLQEESRAQARGPVEEILVLLTGGAADARLAFCLCCVAHGGAW